MKKLIALAVVIFVSGAIVTFAGEPVSSSKEVVAPPPPPPPPSYFRPNEFDLGVFATYVTGTGSGRSTSRTDDFGDTLSLHSEPISKVEPSSPTGGATVTVERKGIPEIVRS